MEVGYPDDFRCPISLEVMTDPVILSSGHTFDRASIQRWLADGNRTCPVTNLPLPPSPSLIPNHALRSLISSFPQHAHLQFSDSPSCPRANLKAALASFRYPADCAALRTLLRLAKNGGDACSRMILDSGAPSVLLRHAGGGDGGGMAEEQRLALQLLLQLSLDGDDARVGLVAEGAVDRLVAALRGGDEAVAALAATTLTSLAVVEVNKATIGAHPGAIPALAALLRAGGGRERREAATALYALAAFPENRRRAVRAGAVPALARFAAAGSERATEVLGLLAKCPEGRDEMKKIPGLIKIFARIIRNGSSRSVEHALLVLKLLCADSSEMGSEARREGMLELCYDFIRDNNGKIGKNALELARALERIEFGILM